MPFPMTLSIECWVCFSIIQLKMSSVGIWTILGFNIGLCNLGFFTVPLTPCLSNGICISKYTKIECTLQQLYSRMARYSRLGQGCLSLVVHPPPKMKRAKLKSKKKLTIFTMLSHVCFQFHLFHTIVFAVSSSYLPICSYHPLF